MLVGFARHVGMEVATLFTDIEKFYEFASHELLAVEGLQTNFLGDLFGAICTMYAGPMVASAKL